MLKANNKLIIFLLLSIFGFASVFAQPTIRASLDSVNLQMGRISHIKLSIEQKEGTKGVLPLFSKLNESGIIPICNDSVELRFPSRCDTSVSDGYMKILMEIPIQSFDSGLYQIPEFVYVAGNDTVRSNELALKVIPVRVSEKDSIDDYASTSEPADKSILDFLPDFIYDFWWLIFILIAAIAGMLYLLKRYRKEGHILPKKPEPTPYEVAISSLISLKEKKLWEQGMEKEYFTKLTEILRIYLYGRFGINAMEMTSRQILASLSKNPEIKEKRSYMRQILDMADFVKFAKVRPLPDDNVASYNNALRFVEETKPVETSEEASDKDNVLPKKIKGEDKKGGDK